MYDYRDVFCLPYPHAFFDRCTNFLIPCFTGVWSPYSHGCLEPIFSFLAIGFCYPSVIPFLTRSVLHLIPTHRLQVPTPFSLADLDRYSSFAHSFISLTFFLPLPPSLSSLFRGVFSVSSFSSRVSLSLSVPPWFSASFAYQLPTRNNTYIHKAWKRRTHTLSHHYGHEIRKDT